MQKEIVVEVDPNGQIKIEGKGFIGTQCQKATRYLEEKLGLRTSLSKKSEFYEVEQKQKAGR
jgi:hypothetical protein